MKFEYDMIAFDHLQYIRTYKAFLKTVAKHQNTNNRYRSKKNNALNRIIKNKKV